MARPIEIQLSQELRDCKLEFLGWNPVKLDEIYDAVKNEYPDLCDDEYKCNHYQRNSIQPEWKHTVRNVLNGLKKKGLAQGTGNRYEWIILPPV